MVSSQDWYDGWGNRQAGSTTDPVAFGGQMGYYTDHENGLVLLGHRYYDPTRGAFLNRDPIGYNGGVNLYGCAGDNPVNEADPSGWDPYKLPDNPSELPEEWEQIDHGDKNAGNVNPKTGKSRGPNGEERWISPGGNEGLEYHPKQPGMGGKQEFDHWHILRRGKKGKWVKQDAHLRPGTVIQLKRPYLYPFNDKPIQKDCSLEKLIFGSIFGTFLGSAFEINWPVVVPQHAFSH